MVLPVFHHTAKEARDPRQQSKNVMQHVWRHIEQSWQLQVPYHNLQSLLFP